MTCIATRLGEFGGRLQESSNVSSGIDVKSGDRLKYFSTISSVIEGR